jgi:hypothetical protein
LQISFINWKGMENNVKLGKEFEIDVRFKVIFTKNIDLICINFKIFKVNNTCHCPLL